MQPVKSLKCQLSHVRRIHLFLLWHLEMKSGLEFLVLRNVPLYLRRNKSSQSFFDREWSTYGPLDSHGPMNCATGGFTIPCIVLQDLFYCSDTTRSCRPTIAVHLWLRKPFSQKIYSLDSMHAKSKFNRRVHVSSKLFFSIPYFTSYSDANYLPLRQMCNNLCFVGHPIWPYGGTKTPSHL